MDNKVREIMIRLLQGKMTKEIGDELGVPVRKIDQTKADFLSGLRPTLSTGTLVALEDTAMAMARWKLHA